MSLFYQDIERTHFCFADYLEIRDGSQFSSPFLSIRCGTIQGGPIQIYSTGQFMYVAFHTDEQTTRGGFAAQVTAVDR